MESLQIYESNKSSTFKIKWDRMAKTNNEWEFFDLTKPEVMQSLIHEYFPTDILHISIGRKDSYSVEKNKLFQKIQFILGQKDFKIWDEHFTQVMELSEHAAYRTGKVAF